MIFTILITIYLTAGLVMGLIAYSFFDGFPRKKSAPEVVWELFVCTFFWLPCFIWMAIFD